jgi:hypothetical protein
MASGILAVAQRTIADWHGPRPVLTENAVTLSPVVLPAALPDNGRQKVISDPLAMAPSPDCPILHLAQQLLPCVAAAPPALSTNRITGFLS